MTAESVVRLATLADRDSIVALIQKLHDENGLFPLSEAKVAWQVDRYYVGNTSTIGVIGPEGAIEAAIYLSIEEPYYSDALEIFELFNVVDPDHRRSGHAKALIKFAKRCSDSSKLTLMIGIMSNHRTEAKIRLYEKQGLQSAGRFFVYNPQFAGGASWQRPEEAPGAVGDGKQERRQQHDSQ